MCNLNVKVFKFKSHITSSKDTIMYVPNRNFFDSIFGNFLHYTTCSTNRLQLSSNAVERVGHPCCFSRLCANSDQPKWKYDSAIGQNPKKQQNKVKRKFRQSAAWVQLSAIGSTVRQKTLVSLFDDFIRATRGHCFTYCISLYSTYTPQDSDLKTIIIKIS